MECHYYIFSDDIEWCRNNIGKDLNYCEYINHNLGNDAWQDIILMKNCKHNIIANSSFSWWGAWLNENIDKIVISPHNWFANAKYEILTSELIPEDWVLAVNILLIVSKL
ncbi:MAG: alpha-1,2-fucosyltransferase [Saprospiraceae bacterium]|nr:alpha-1,2-fucosyltransferase [Candidatus Brachybacter algidus]